MNSDAQLEPDITPKNSQHFLIFHSYLDSLSASQSLCQLIILSSQSTSRLVSKLIGQLVRQSVSELPS